MLLETELRDWKRIILLCIVLLEAAFGDSIHPPSPKGKTVRGETRCETIDIETGEIVCESAWLFQFGTSKNDVVNSVVTDGERIYFGGSTYGSLGSRHQGFGDAFIGALNCQDGELLWSRQFGSAKGDELAGVGTLRNGTVVAAGSTFGSLPGHRNNGQLDTWRVTLDDEGALIAENQMGSNKKDTIEAIATGNDDDSLFLGGTTFGHVEHFCSATDAVDMSSSSSSYEHTVASSEVDDNDEGEESASTVENAGHGDAWIARYDQVSTHLMWATQIASPRADTLAGIAVSTSLLVAAGTTFGVLGGETLTEKLGKGDAWVASISASDGSIQWTTRVGSEMNDEASAVALDSEGNIILVGTTFGDLELSSDEAKPGGKDIFVAKLHPKSGDLIWTRLLGSSRNDDVHAVAVGESTIYLAGATHGNFRRPSSGKSDAWLAFVSLKNGELLDAVQFGHADRDSLDAVAIAPDGDLILAGSTDGNFADCNAGLKDVWVARVHPERAIAFFSAFDHDRHLSQPCSNKGIGETSTVTWRVPQRASQPLVLEEEVYI